MLFTPVLLLPPSSDALFRLISMAVPIELIRVCIRTVSQADGNIHYYYLFYINLRYSHTLAVTTSTVLHWCMIEAGLSNIASNLPLLQGMIPFKLFRDFRSTLGSYDMRLFSFGYRSNLGSDDVHSESNDVSQLTKDPMKGSSVQMNDVHLSSKLSTSPNV